MNTCIELSTFVLGPFGFTMIVEVTLLDGSLAKFDLDSKCSGQDLLDRVAEHLNLVSAKILSIVESESEIDQSTSKHYVRLSDKLIRIQT